MLSSVSHSYFVSHISIDATPKYDHKFQIMTKAPFKTPLVITPPPPLNPKRHLTQCGQGSICNSPVILENEKLSETLLRFMINTRSTMIVPEAAFYDKICSQKFWKIPKETSVPCSLHFVQNNNMNFETFC